MEQKRKSLEHGNGGRANNLGIVLSDLLFGWARAERGFVARRHGALWRTCAFAACRTRAASAARSRLSSLSDRRARWGKRSPARRRKRPVVECVLADDFSLLVRRGRLSADALWKLCCAGRFSACRNLRLCRRRAHFSFFDQGLAAARARTDSRRD